MTHYVDSIENQNCQHWKKEKRGNICEATQKCYDPEFNSKVSLLTINLILKRFVSSCVHEKCPDTVLFQCQRTPLVPIL